MAAGALALGPMVGCSGGSDDAPRYRHVVVISLDTTRADRIGCYGAGEVLTPAIDGLAEEGVRFADCTSAAATTLASHASLFTGLVPPRHGIPRNGYVLDEENTTLAQRLDEAGFHCAGFIGSAALTARTGIDAGFAHYDEDFGIAAGEGGADQSQRPGTAVTAALLDHLDAQLARDGAEDARLFLFAHYFDPHAPYAPPAAEVARYRAGFAVGDFARIENAVRQQQERATGRALGQNAVINDGLTAELLRGASGVPTATGRELDRLYAGEITATDAAVGRLLAGLAARGVLEDAIVVLTADHGETFWEHGNAWNHGLWVSQTDVSVPLIVRLPDGRGAGKVVDVPVSGVDVTPTLLDLLGLDDPSASEPEVARGRSLGPAIDGGTLPERAVFTFATQPGPKVERGGAPGDWLGARKPVAVRLGPWKLVDAPYLGLRLLFHLGRDPGERTDLLLAPVPATDASTARGRLEAELDALRRDVRPRSTTFDAQQAKQLMGLGYVESSPPR
ncbi:MAG: sulfatase [Planctomycetota bacterium]